MGDNRRCRLSSDKIKYLNLRVKAVIAAWF